MSESRPNPDQVLERVQADEARRVRGKLKVFLGAAAVVGKPCALLETARARRATGLYVVVGYVGSRRGLMTPEPDRPHGGAPGAGGPGPTVVLIEDEPQIRRFLRPTLAGEGYRLVEAATAEEGLLQASTQRPDLVILDLGLPDFDGLEVLRRLREWTAVPVIVLSARGQERDKVAALDAGADDYVAKPFAVGELLARVRAALRRAARLATGHDEAVFQAGDLRVDLARRRVSLGGAEVRLTPTEYRLLATLIRHAGKVLTHRQLLQEVWGAPYVEQTQYLRVYMTQLRHKLEAEPSRPKLLVTEPGVGYRLQAE
jgi:two-component system KDP operon response regulator KdpE